MTDVDTVGEIERWLRDRNRFGATDYREQAEGLVATIRAHDAFRAALLGVPSLPPSSPVGGTEPPDGPPEPPAAERLTGRPESPDAATAQQDRRTRYITALRKIDSERQLSGGQRSAYAEAVMLVADAEQREHNVVCIGERNQLHAEVDRLKANICEIVTRAEDAEAEVDRLEDVARCPSAQELADARAEVDDLKAEVADLSFVNEVDARALAKALATIERVKALAESWRYTGGWGPWQAGEGPGPDDAWLDSVAHQILKALDAPTGPEDLQQARTDGTLVEKVTLQDGSGMWLADTGLAGHDPPYLTETDRLAAVRRRLDAAGERMEAT